MPEQKSSPKSDSGIIFSPYKRLKKDDWLLERKGYSIQFEVIGKDIIYTKVHGSLKEQYVEDFFDLHRKVLEDIKINGEGYYRIANWKGLIDVSWKARRLYLEGLKRLDKDYTCVFSVVFGVNKFMKAVINISRQFAPFKIASTNSLKEALHIIEQAKKGKIRTEKIKKGEKLRSQTYNKEQLDHYIEELLMVMGEIDWDKEQLQEKRISLESHPFRSIYESLFIIKQDFDTVLKEKEQAEKVQEVLFNISNAIIQTMSLEDLLSLVHREVNRLMDARNFFVALSHDKKENLYTCPYFADENEEELLKIVGHGKTVKLSRSFTDYVFKTEKPLLVDRKKVQELLKRGEVDLIGTPSASWMGVPLRTKVGKIIGVVVVQSYTKTDTYSEKDLEILSVISNTIAMAIKYKQSEEELAEYREHLEKLVRERTAELEIANTKLQEEIAERKQALNALRKSEERFRTLFEESKDMIFITTPRGDFLKINPAGVELLELDSLEDLRKMNARDFFADPEDRKKAQRIVEEKNFIKDFEFVLKTKKGKELIVQETTTAVRDEKGHVIEYKGIIRDVTEKIMKEKQLQRINRKLSKINKELQEATDAAENANRSKSEFLANISHEIRTPLSAILGFSELIINTSTLREDIIYAGQIISESEVLLNLLNDLLDISKVDAGKLELESLLFDLEGIMDSIHSSMIIRAQKKGLNFTVSIEKNTPTRLIGDPTRLRQILVNLIGNAIKFTEKGSVKVNIKVHEDLKDRVILYFEIKDTGIGIEEEKQTAIFESFIQANGSTSRKYGGTGLGTTISKNLVELMGGKIGVRSKVGKGSIFWFTALFQKCTISELPESEEKHKEPVSIPFEENDSSNREGSVLLVEDYATNREIAEAHLRSVGYNVVCAGSGKEAVEVAERRRFDIILMDIRMPGMDGFEAAKLIRSSRRKTKNPGVPIIAMTANIYQEDRERCFASGMNGIITKPIRRKPFINTVVHWINLTKVDPKIKTDKKASNDVKKVSMEGKNPINYRHAIKEFDGDKDLLDHLIGRFLENLETQIPVLSESLKKKDAEKMRQEAHKIKGGAANLTAFPLSTTARKLEAIAETGNLEKANKVLDELNKEFKKLKEFFNKK